MLKTIVCRVTETPTITSRVSAPMVNFTVVPDVCADASSFPLFQGSPSGGVYSGTGISSDSIFDPAVAGVGNFTIDYNFTDTNSRLGSASQDVTVNALPIVDLGDDIELCGAQTATFDAGNTGSSFLWKNGKTDQSLIVNQSHTVWAVVTDLNSCVASDTVIVDNTANCVGVDELTQAGAIIKLYPNPTVRLLNVSIQGLEGDVQLEVLDVHAKLLMKQSLNLQSG